MDKPLDVAQLPRWRVTAEELPLVGVEVLGIWRLELPDPGRSGRGAYNHLTTHPAGVENSIGVLRTLRRAVRKYYEEVQGE